MFPRQGPIAGGTEISIRGSQLNTGANIEVYMGPRGEHPCTVDR